MSTQKGDTLGALDAFAWGRLRLMAARFSPTLARACSDGDYLSASKLLGGLILPVALLAGFFIGYTHFAYQPEDKPLYLYSFPAMLILMALSQHGAGVGFAAWSGYAVGELLYGFFGEYKAQKLLGMLGGWGLLLAVLWILVVGAPLASRQLWMAVRPKLKPQWRTQQTAVLFAAGLAFFFVFMWSHTASSMLQQVYVWRGLTPMTHGLVQAQRGGALVLGAAAAYFGAARVMFETAAEGSEAFRAVQKARQEAMAAALPPETPARLLVGALLKAAYIEFLLASYIPSWLMIFVVFAILGATLSFRALVLPRLGLGQSIGRIPLIYRLPATVVLIYVVSHMTVGKYWSSNTFIPLLWTTVISIVIGSIMLPPAARPKPALAGSPA